MQSAATTFLFFTNININNSACIEPYLLNQYFSSQNKKNVKNSEIATVQAKIKVFFHKNITNTFENHLIF